MTEPSVAPPDRLDSWKAIADYLGREVRTVRRWEQKLGLPVRRVRGERGHSVFAFASEIDAWLKATPPAGPNDAADAAGRVEPPAPATRRAAAPVWAVAAIGLILAVAGIAWRAHRPPADVTKLQFQATADGFLARGPDGDERWRYSFPAGEQAVLMIARSGGAFTVLDHDAGVLVGVAHRLARGSDAHIPGELLWFSVDGVLKQRFAFSERVRFGSVEYGDWILTDYRVFEQDGHRRIAVSARDETWWPAVVTVLDDNWRRTGTFVNAGWIDHLYWLGRHRLLVSGFSNARDGGMVALLDADAPDGVSPAWDPAFRCASCGNGTPVRYVVFPRSEVNRVMGAPFNRAQSSLAAGRITVRTLETPIQPTAGAAEAFYELTASLDVVGASFSDRYWECHRALEVEGRIRHSRDACPDRDGPRAVAVWDAAAGWREIRPAVASTR